MSTTTIERARNTGTTETAAEAAKRITAYLEATADDYREFGHYNATMDKSTAATGLVHADLHTLYYRLLEVRNAASTAEWTGTAPWDDAFERITRAAVHAYTADLTHILNAYGITGEVVADSLAEITA